MMKLPQKPFYFLRHGETEWNKLNIIMGSMDIPLSEHGIKQAHEASRLLEGEKFEVIISSPLIRARRTAEIIANKAKKPLIFEPNLRERVWGEAEGKPADFKKSLLNDGRLPVGAETFSAFQQRVLEAVSSLLLKEPLSLLVAHAGIFKVLTADCGYEGMRSPNCTPFFFKPPLEPASCWKIISLSDEKRDEK